MSRSRVVVCFLSLLASVVFLFSASLAEDKKSDDETVNVSVSGGSTNFHGTFDKDGNRIEDKDAETDIKKIRQEQHKEHKQNRRERKRELDEQRRERRLQKTE